MITLHRPLSPAQKRLQLLKRAIKSTDPFDAETMRLLLLETVDCIQQLQQEARS